MKKIIAICLMLTVVSPMAVHAQTTSNEELLARIQDLLTQVLALLERVKALEAAQSTPVLGAIPQVLSTSTVEPTSTSTPVANPGTNTLLDNQAREYMADLGYDKAQDACLGRRDTKEAARLSRLSDPIFNRACELWGY